MAPITISTKFELRRTDTMAPQCGLWRWIRLTFSCAIGLIFATEGTAAMKESFGKLPVIKNIGLVPVVWVGQAQEGQNEGRIQTVDQSYLAALRDARRFRVINDEIIADLWSTSEGRRELTEEFEVNALASMSLYAEADAITFVLRLTNLQMDNYLVESDRVSREWFQTCLDEELKDRIESLVFRLLNRIPVDLSVTSVQDRFVTLSAGLEQNLSAGDALTFYRSTITSVHPANGSWLSFENKKLGEAVVLEVQANSSIAEIKSLSFEGAIEIGDGARIDAIQTRAKFKRLAQKPLFHDSGDDSPIVPLPGGPEKRKEVVKPVPQQVAPRPLQGAEPTKRAEALPPPAEAPPATAEASPTAEPKPAVPEDELDLVSTLRQLLKSMHFGTGVQSWGVSGASQAHSVPPSWVLNHFELGLQKNLGPLAADVIGDLEYGSTVKGVFTGLGLTARAKYALGLEAPLDGMSFGAVYRYKSFGVDGEKFGGGNAMKYGGLVSFDGIFTLPRFETPMIYNAEFSYFPFASGSFGVNGKDRAINGLSGFRIYGEAVAQREKGHLDWGAYLCYSAEDFALSRGELGVLSHGFGILTRYRF